MKPKQSSKKLSTLTVIVSQNSSFAAQAKLTSQTDLLKSQLRYAQARSLNANQIWGLTAQANQLWLFSGASTGNPVLLPSERVTPVTYNTGDLSDITVSDFTVSFDDLGRPCQGDAGTTPLAAALNITVTNTRTSASLQVQITPNTGFIP